MQQLLRRPQEHYKHVVFNAVYNPAETGLKDAIERLCNEVEAAVRNGAVLLVLSDKKPSAKKCSRFGALICGRGAKTAVDTNLRCDANMIVETASARNPHHFAVLIGLGATAVYPYLAYESLAHMVNVGAITKPMRVVMANFRNSVNKGLYKIMSKMGISCVSSYRCARLFEVVGLNSEIVGLCFPGITSRVEGASFADLHDQLCAMRKRAWQRSKEGGCRRLAQIQAAGRIPCLQPRSGQHPASCGKQRRLQPIPPLRRCGQQAPRGHHPRYAVRENRRAHTDFC